MIFAILAVALTVVALGQLALLWYALRILKESIANRDLAMTAITSGLVNLQMKRSLKEEKT